MSLSWPRAVRMPELVLDGVVLEADDVCVTYGDFTALFHVDLEVRAGEVVAVVGPNGAGKSTLLGVLAGDIDPTRGSVTIDGRPVREWSHRELAMRRAVLLQQVQVAFPFTVTEVVRLGRGAWAGTDAEDRDDELVASAMLDTDVVQFATRAYPTLSGGEQARTALARVLAQDANLLLLDEPTAALDVRHQEQVLEIARRRALAGGAVVVVMHDLSAAAAYADRVVVLSRGRVAADGPPAAVFTPELLTDVWQYPIDVIRHPDTDDVLVVPHRRRDL